MLKGLLRMILASVIASLLFSIVVYNVLDPDEILPVILVDMYDYADENTQNNIDVQLNQQCSQMENLELIKTKCSQAKDIENCDAPACRKILDQCKYIKNNIQNIENVKAVCETDKSGSELFATFALEMMPFEFDIPKLNSLSIIVSLLVTILLFILIHWNDYIGLLHDTGKLVLNTSVFIILPFIGSLIIKPYIDTSYILSSIMSGVQPPAMDVFSNVFPIMILRIYDQTSLMIAGILFIVGMILIIGFNKKKDNN